VTAEGEGTTMNTNRTAGKSRLGGTGVATGSLASHAGNRISRIVVDKTGLTEFDDFTLEWAPDDSLDPIAPSLVTAVQLGLRRERERVPWKCR
jgi:uncharacterized protein (TIGR03435 family)